MQTTATKTANAPTLQWPKTVEITVRAQCSAEDAARAQAQVGKKSDEMEVVSVRILD